MIPDQLSKIKPKNKSETKCEVCQKNLSSHFALQDHFIKAHTIHYLCPYENCGHTIQNLTDQKSQFSFARHMFYHDHEHPQLSCPHVCLACGYR